MNGKISNQDQIISAYELTFDQGIACGKKVILVHNGSLELMISKTNALDILYLKYNGKNISFLSKNGINENADGKREYFKGNEAKNALRTSLNPRLSRYRSGKAGTTIFFLFIARTVK